MESISSVSSSIGIDAIFQYVGSGVQLFSGTIFYIIISRIFTPTGVGAISLFIAIIGLFNVIFSFGLGATAQHFTSFNLGKGDNASVKKTIFRILEYGVLFSIVGFTVLFLLSPYISLIFLHSENYVFFVRVLSIILVGNILFGILNGALLGIQNFRLSAFVNIVIWISYYMGSILLAYFFHSLFMILIGWLCGIFFGVLMYGVAIFKSLDNIPKNGNAPSANSLFNYSLPILLAGLISYGSTYSDRFVVSGLMNLSSLGFYTYALLVASSISIIVLPFNNILMPKFSELYGSQKRSEISHYVKFSTILLSLIYVPSALGISALSGMILTLLGGTNYSIASMALSIIMVTSAIFVTQNVLTQAVASIRKTRVFVYSSTQLIECIQY